MSDVRPFFERFARAFEAFDAGAIAECFVVPCLFVRDGATEAADTGEDVAASVRALLDLHRAWDVQTVGVGEVAVLEQAPDHALARVGWQLGRTGSRLTWSFATTYALVPSADDWRIAVAITHDAPF